MRCDTTQLRRPRRRVSSRASPSTASPPRQSETRRDAVRLGTQGRPREAHRGCSSATTPIPNRLRHLAGEIKQHTLDHLDTLPRAGAKSRLKANGAKVHFAADADAACRTVLDDPRSAAARKRVVKAKTMVSEEIELARFLEHHGIESLETDLGEFIVQLDHDHPSHIVKPIIHKNRREIAQHLRARGPRRLRRHARGDHPPRARTSCGTSTCEADVGITGANFVSAESGRLVLVTNEGNSRFCLAATRCHIALVGIEKIVPRDRDLAVLLNLLARSGTGQKLTVYTEFISGPRAASAARRPRGDARHLHRQRPHRRRSRATAARSCAASAAAPASTCARSTGRRAATPTAASTPGPVGAVLTPLLAGEQFPANSPTCRARRACAARATKSARSTSRSPICCCACATAARRRRHAGRRRAVDGDVRAPGVEAGVWRRALRLGRLLGVASRRRAPARAARLGQEPRRCRRGAAARFASGWRNGSATRARANVSRVAPAHPRSRARPRWRPSPTSSRCPTIRPTSRCRAGAQTPGDVVERFANGWSPSAAARSPTPPRSRRG